MRSPSEALTKVKLAIGYVGLNMHYFNVGPLGPVAIINVSAMAGIVCQAPGQSIGIAVPKVPHTLTLRLVSECAKAKIVRGSVRSKCSSPSDLSKLSPRRSGAQIRERLLLRVCWVGECTF